ncbi:30S ribosomal protein S17 [Candidatus Saccharibacteria bacterium]|nr:30S ribosomal protein S17 [Candidatus Saccharibacteria bacterium]
MAHTLIGTVTSEKRDKTITVSIVNRETHPLYRKQYTKTRKYTAHDEKNEAHVGDRVQIAMSRPISKTKAYTLVKIIEKSRGAVELKDDVNKAYEAEKIGADEIAKAKKLEEAEKEAKSEDSSASENSAETEVETDKEGEEA